MEWLLIQIPQASFQLLKKSSVVNLVVLKLYNTNNSFLEQINQKHDAIYPVIWKFFSLKKCVYKM